MSRSDNYFLRSRARERQNNSESEALSESEASFESTEMEDQQVPAGDRQVHAIVATLNALRASVEELRNSTVESQRDIIRLREEFRPQNTGEQIAVAQPAQPQQRESTVVTPSTDSTIKLYDLPTFGGNAEEWPLFIANLNDTTAAFGYSHRQNLMRLQKCLVGPAKEAVAAMLIYPNDVPNVISELQFRFGRPDILVKHQLQKLQQFPPIAEQKLEQIVPFSSRVRNVVAFLKSANCPQQLANFSLLEQAVSKLPQNKQFEWAKHSVTISPFATLEDFSKWLGDLARVICLMPSNTHSIRTNAVSNPRRIMHIQEERSQKAAECLRCSGDHIITNCTSFKSADVQNRWEYVKNNQLCFSCLRKGHITGKCRSKKLCGIDGCRRYHNSLLHNDEGPCTISRQNGQNNSSVQPILNCRLVNGTPTQLFKMLPISIYGPNGKYEILAMFDEGSAITILEERIARLIGVRGQSHPLTLQWYDDRVVTEQSFKINLEIGSQLDQKKFTLKDVYTVKDLNLPEQSFTKEHFTHLDHVPLQNYGSTKPALLIGLNQAYLGATTTLVQSDNESPIAAKTSLGWVAYGPTKSSATSQPRVMVIKEQQKLHNLVCDYFLADSFGVSPTVTQWESDVDKKARHILETTTTLQSDKHYEVGLPWKKFPPQFPNSREMAERRLLSIEKRMHNDEHFGKRYKEEMDKYVEKGYARRLTQEEVMTSCPQTWFLPHFAVSNPHKPSKLRIVFDAAAAVKGTSLNSALLKGPEQAQPLIRVLLQFRQSQIGVAADICEMFSQIKVRPADQHAQRYLWRNGDSSQPIHEYIMTSMIFGAVCSPCIAEFVKNRNAERFKSEYPEASSIIVNKHYVDDLVASFNSSKQAIEICRRVVQIHQEAGFQLRNFISNSPEVETKLNPSSSPAQKTVNMECSGSTDKVLGLYWNTRQDTFEFHTKFHGVQKDVLEGTRSPTKRELLQIVMAVFDPFGMLSDLLIFSKLLIQDMWRHNIGWDEAMPAELNRKWLLWWQEFKNVSLFKMPRCYSTHISSKSRIELHIFADASQVAFSAVGYIRVAHQYKVDISFVMGKTRTAPIKLLSIPRLELQAAVLGTRLCKLLVNAHEFKIERVVFWTDSQTVLRWLNSSERKYKPYVGHRIAEILNSTSQDQWRWVPTCQNPADAATRPSSPPKFSCNSIWAKGPDFLKLDEQYWPAMNITPSTSLLEEEVPNRILCIQSTSAVIQFKRFGSYSKLQRTVAWVLRATKLFRDKTVRANLPSQLTAAEIEKAEYAICKMVQHKHFGNEIADLSAQRAIKKQSSLYKLSPYLDQRGLLRLSGRVDEAVYLPLQARRPILLPHQHIVSTLIVRHYHLANHHQNIAVTINAIRQTFWIPKLKSLYKSIQRSCIVCCADRAKPKPPLMGQLPSDRVTPFVRPFTYSGVDLFGPFDVTIGRRREKRWGVIFTCLTIRAVHIELAENLSTDAFILCLRNFVNRRGTPVRLRSDNGTNFIGAQRELASADQLLDTDRIRDEATKHHIEWIFNCPANPSSGGCWERLIRVVKSLLNKTLRQVAPREHTLQSVLIEAENIVNSRPLTDLPISHEDDEPLTPNHFIMGCVNSTQTPHPVDEKICLKKQWRISQNLKDRLWKRWATEYLPQLICRTKWHDTVPPLQVGDLVILLDPALPRKLWQRGRITEVYPAKDGQVRVAEVKTSSGILRRPASRLARLMVDGESSSDSRGVEC